jgi:hypothetical protein
MLMGMHAPTQQVLEQQMGSLNDVHLPKIIVHCSSLLGACDSAGAGVALTTTFVGAGAAVLLPCDSVAEGASDGASLRLVGVFEASVGELLGRLLPGSTPAGL